MAWQDLFPLPGARIDAEEERELRLVAQARGGADWALSALVARYQPTVSRYLSRLTGSVEQSRVLAERIFHRMDQRIRGPQGGKQLRLWLLRTSTEMGLDALREPRSHTLRALAGPHGPAGLLPGKAVTGPLRMRLSGLSEMTTKTSRQVRKLIWSAPDEPPVEVGGSRASRNGHAPSHDADGADDPFSQLDPREALRFKMIRAVLAELPYGDAQCLALHLVAGLNQAEVARALGITGSAARRRVVHGLQLFAMRYEAAAASLRLPTESVRERTARVFEAPALAEEFTEPAARLSNGAVPRGGATMPPPPFSTEPPRIVSANPRELFEDESAEQLDRNIAAYDLADEATVVIDPIVVEADSTLPVPVADIARETGAPLSELWFARDVNVVPEPQIAVGSVPLGDTALILEVVDEPLDAPPQPESVAPAAITEFMGDRSDRSNDDLAPAPTVEAEVSADAALDESDELVLVDLDAMIETPLSNAANDAAEETYPIEAITEIQTDDVSDAAEFASEEPNPDDLVSIADVREPEVAALSGSTGLDDARTAAVGGASAERDDILIGDIPDATPVASASVAPAPDSEPPAPPRVPRRVPVLTKAGEVSQVVARPPRRVPVLTTDPTPEEIVSEHAEPIARQAHVERVSHR